jgi:hypothetical protein
VRDLQKIRSPFRNLRILQAGRTRNLDRAHGRQGGVVQGSRREYPLGLTARLGRL